jgi:hypothetical protein
MAHITGHDRFQTLLLPEAVDDYVSSDNPVRFIDAFVDGLDLAAAGISRVASKVTGRPGCAPTDLLKLHIDGYLNRVRSSRRLEAKTGVPSFYPASFTINLHAGELNFLAKMPRRERHTHKAKRCPYTKIHRLNSMLSGQ